MFLGSMYLMSTLLNILDIPFTPQNKKNDITDVKSPQILNIDFVK